MIKRIMIYIVGILILGFGIVLNTKTGLGVAAINSVPYAISEISSLTLGNATTLLYILFVAVQLIIYRRFDIKVILQIPFSYLMGVIIDFYNQVLNFPLDSLFLSYGLLVVAIISTALGAYLVVTMDFVPNPADGMVKSISYVVKKEFGKVKMIFDISMMVLTIVMTYIVMHHIIGIGIGTILSACCIGQVIVIYNKYLSTYLQPMVIQSQGK